VAYPGVLRRRGLRVLAKGAWATLAAVAVWLTTIGLGASFYVENTPDTLAAERRGSGLVVLASVLLMGLAAVAWLAFDAPRWSVTVLGALAVVLLIASGSGSGFWFIPTPFLAVPAAAVGVLWLPRSRKTATGDQVSRG